MLFSDYAPQWVSVLFLMVIFIPIFMIANLVRKGSVRPSVGRFNYLLVLAFYGIYFVYVTIACMNGLFEEATLPPKILKFTMIPLLLFLMIVVFNLKAYRQIIERIALSDLVRLHIFRLIGSFFLILGFYKALPPTIALIAGLGDVITAVSSLYVARCLVQQKSFAKKLTLAWNTFGFLDIILTSATAFILTKLSIETGAQGVDALGVFPFCFIPAFAPATILFLHFTIYRKILKKN